MPFHHATPFEYASGVSRSLHGSAGWRRETKRKNLLVQGPQEAKELK